MENPIRKFKAIQIEMDEDILTSVAINELSHTHTMSD